MITNKENTTLERKINDYAIFIEFFSSLSIEKKIIKYREVRFDKNHEFHYKVTDLYNRLKDFMKNSIVKK